MLVTQTSFYVDYVNIFDNVLPLYFSYLVGLCVCSIALFTKCVCVCVCVCVCDLCVYIHICTSMFGCAHVSVTVVCAQTLAQTELLSFFNIPF